ncbi:3-deoxy-D-manno-octulosonic acid kinase [Luteimonas sp. e5]
MHMRAELADHAAGCLLWDAAALPRPAQVEWFEASHWGEAAQSVGSGGRGAAWFIDAPWGAMVLRRYLRGGLVARISHDRYLWQGEAAVRSFAEFHLLQQLLQRELPVPRPLAAAYWRHGLAYRAAILIERIAGVRSLADALLADAAPWRQSGELIARFHRHGLWHADLNAHNLLFDGQGKGWMIDFDRSRLRAEGDGRWRRANLARLRRSLDKVAGEARAATVAEGFVELEAAYAAAMSESVAR